MPHQHQGALDEYDRYARSLTRRAEAVRGSKLDRARELARKAGLDPSMPFLHAHNAMVSFDHGHPWKGVNYRYVRQIRHLESHLFDAERKVSSLKKKAWHKVSVGMGYKGNRSRGPARNSRGRYTRG